MARKGGTCLEGDGAAGGHAVMLSEVKHLSAHGDRPFAAAQGDTVRLCYNCLVMKG